MNRQGPYVRRQRGALDCPAEPVPIQSAAFCRIPLPRPSDHSALIRAARRDNFRETVFL
jgi:hypothetical protein